MKHISYLPGINRSFLSKEMMVSLSCLLSCPVFAADTLWTGNAQGNWYDGLNWNNGVSISTSRVVFDTPTDVTVIVQGGNPAASSSVIQFEPTAGPVTFNINNSFQVGSDGGAGLVNNSNHRPVFNNHFSMSFLNNASASDAIVNNYGIIYFQNNTSMDHALITNDGSLFLYNNASAGNATIVNNEHGILVTASSLTGTPTFSQNNIVNNGFFEARAESSTTMVLNADITVGSSGELVLKNQTGGTIDVSQAHIINNGLVNLTGYAGDITIGNMSGAGNLEFNHSNLTLNTSLVAGQTNILSGQISGNGDLIFAGHGTTVLSGNNLYWGDTILNSGILQLDSPVKGNIIINGGMLTGSHSNGGSFADWHGINAVSSAVINNGVYGPGIQNDTVKHIDINGDYIQSSSGSFLVKVVNGQSNSLGVTGSATIEGNLVVQTLEPLRELQHSFAILRAEGGIQGQFEFTPSVYGPFMAEQVFYSTETAASNGFTTMLLPTDIIYGIFYTDAFYAAAASQNQRTIANILSETGGNLVINETILSFTTAAQLSDFFSQLSGATYANQVVSIAQMDREFENQLGRRIDAYQDCVTQNVRYLPSDTREYFACNDQVSWVQIYAGNQGLKKQNNVSGLNTNMLGIDAGIEGPVLAKNTVVGAGIGLVDFRGHAVGAENAEFNGDLYQLGVYLRNQIQTNWRVGAALGYTFNTNNQAQRTISTSLGDRIVTSDYNAYVLNAQARASYRFYLENGSNWQPIVGLLYQGVTTSNISEGDNPDIALSIDGQDYNSLRSQLGIEVDFTTIYWRMTPFLLLAWEHEFSDTTATFTGTIQGIGVPMNIISTDIGANTLDIQAGLWAMPYSDWDLGISYEGHFNKGYTQNMIVLQLAFF